MYSKIFEHRYDLLFFLIIFTLFFRNIEENNGLAAIGMFIPWLTKLFPTLSGYEAMMKDMVPLLNFLDTPILHHKKTHVTGQPRDFIDVYIDEIKKTTDPKSSFYRSIGGLCKIIYCPHCY